MFYLFFQNYKNQFYNKSWGTLSIKEKIALGFLALSGLFVFILPIINLIKPTYWLQYASLGMLLIMVIVIICIYSYVLKSESGELKKNIKKFKNERIKWIIETLQNNHINLYSKEGIDWLIQCCKEKIERHDKGFNMPSFRTTMLPLFTMSFGLLINKISSEKVITFTVIFALLLFGIEYLGSGIKSIIIGVTSPDNSKYVYLKEDLEYIKTQYSDLPESSIIVTSK